MRRTVDRHFELTLGPEIERELRLHLPECERCQEHYRRHLLFARLDPAAPPAEARLARGLGLRRDKRAPALVLLAAAAALLLLFVMRPPETAEFTARGAGRGSRLLIYLLRAGSAPTLIEEEMEAGDELAFAYENSEGRRGLMVFGVDEHQHVYWYHPAWRNSAENPLPVSISSGAGVHELPEAVRHELDGERLTIHALFTDEPLSVREVEAALREGASLGETIELKVTR